MKALSLKLKKWYCDKRGHKYVNRYVTLRKRGVGRRAVDYSAQQAVCVRCGVRREPHSLVKMATDTSISLNAAQSAKLRIADYIIIED